MFKSGIFLFSFLLSMPLFAADIRATTANGKAVVLHDNWTWNYVGIGDPKSCKAYADNALAQQRLNQSKGCGFGGVQWHLNYNKHYNWCMKTTPTLRYKQTKLRQDLLTRCGQTGGRAKVCKNYANNAIVQQRANLKRGCGYSGSGRWHTNYNNHYSWCMKTKPPGPANEQKFRNDALARCPTTSVQAIKLISNVATSNSNNFKRNTDNRLRVNTVRWDKVPYRMAPVFSGAVKRNSNQRAFLAGDAAGTASWNIDNFLLIEVSSGGSTTRLVVGQAEPVTIAGRIIKKIGRNSSRFNAKEIDLSPYLPAGKSVHLKVSALDYGGVGGVSNIFLVKR